MKRAIRVAAISILILVVALTAGLLLCRSYGHRALEAYRAELRAKGEKLTFAELVSSLSANTNGSLEVFTNLLVQLGKPPADTTNLAFEYVSPGRVRVSSKQDVPPWTNTVQNGIRLSWRDISNHVTSQAQAVSKLREVLKQPASNAGPRTNCLVVVTPFRVIRPSAEWLVCATLTDLHDHQRAEALANIQAIAGLANLHREEYSLVSQMTRVAVANLGFDLTWEALQTKDWDDKQLLAMKQCWETQDLFEGLERGMVGERCFGGEIRQMLLSQPTNGPMASAGTRFISGTVGGRVYLNTVLDNDFLYQLHHLQGQVEAARALRSGSAWKDVSRSLDQLNERIEKLSHSPRRFLYLMTLVAIPNFKSAFLVSTQTETKRRLTLTAIALERYKRKHGDYAPSLETLVPDLLPAVPVDCMNGRPLRYQRNADGTFTLYSVGNDGTDNGGDSTLVTPGKWGLWDRRDAVWPLPAMEH